MIVKLLIVFGLGAVELWAAIPTGFALGLPPLITATVATLGAASAASVVLVLGDTLRITLLHLHHRSTQDGKRGYIDRIWMRFEVIGLGLLAPLLIGAPLGTAVGIALGAPVKKLILWIIVGVLVWAVLLTTAGILGIAGIQTRE